MANSWNGENIVDIFLTLPVFLSGQVLSWPGWIDHKEADAELGAGICRPFIDRGPDTVVLQRIQTSKTLMRYLRRLLFHRMPS